MTDQSKIEVERKFLLDWPEWLEGREGIEIRQGYVCTGDCVVRARIMGKRGCIVLKGKTEGLQRSEYEYEIPRGDAERILDMFCGDRIIEKIRYEVEYGNHVWELDRFQGRHEGLFLAEVELNHPDEEIEIPPWVGREVSGDPAYFNAALALGESEST